MVGADEYYLEFGVYVLNSISRNIRRQAWKWLAHANFIAIKDTFTRAATWPEDPVMGYLAIDRTARSSGIIIFDNSLYSLCYFTKNPERLVLHRCPFSLYNIG
jgi:hypothetical protein